MMDEDGVKKEIRREQKERGKIQQLAWRKSCIQANRQQKTSIATLNTNMTSLKYELTVSVSYI